MNLKIFTSILCFCLCLSISSCQTTSVTADLVLQNGRIYTVEDPNEVFEAIAIKGDKILNIGSNGELKTHINQKDREGSRLTGSDK